VAFGIHWEWRGFGDLPPAIKSSLERLPLKFPAAQDVTDEYLWVPGRKVNVKLRFRDLKFKRLLGSEDGLERWLEDEEENYPFPLSTSLLGKLLGTLGVEGPRGTQGPLDREGLMRVLGSAIPPVRVVTVEKLRWQRQWGTDEGGGVILELAEIRSPEPIASVALEHPDKERVAEALRILGLVPLLKPLSYVEAVDIWARGGRVGAA